MRDARFAGVGAAFFVTARRFGVDITRAAVRMDSGEVGFSYLLGRDHAKARLAAVCDALWQSEGHRDAIERHVLAPIRLRLERERTAQREQAGAPRVEEGTFAQTRSSDDLEVCPDVSDRQESQHLARHIAQHQRRSGDL